MTQPDAHTILRKLLPATLGFLCLTAIHDGKAYNVPVESIDTLVARAQQEDARGANAFMALAAYAERSIPHPVVPGKMQFRVARNAHAMRSFWLDIDVGPDKAAAGQGYATRDDAVQALGAFCRAIKLPMPLVIGSGAAGLHVYWPLDRDLTADEWRPAAKALKDLCGIHNLLADPARTSDAASVLRVPGTHNYKTGTPALVEVLADAGPYPAERILRVLGAVAPHAPSDDPLFANAPRTLEQHPELSLPIERGAHTLARAVPIINGCLQIRDAGLQPEPVWHRMISVMRLTKSGDRAIHILSSLDPQRYDKADTDRKIAQANAAQGEKGLPATCAEFNRLRPDVCSQCQWFGKIKSPIELGRVPEGAVAAVPVIAVPESAVGDYEPDGADIFEPPLSVVEEFEAMSTVVGGSPVFQTTDGTYMKAKVTHADGSSSETNVLLTPSTVMPYGRSVMCDADGTSQMIYHFEVTANDRKATITIPSRDMADTKAVCRALASQEYHVKANHQTPVADYLAKLGFAARGHVPEIDTHPFFGWSKTGTFTVGARLYMPDGRVRAGQHHESLYALSEACQVVGEMSKWQEAAEWTLRPGNEAFLLALVSGFASPLMRLMQSEAFMLYLWSTESGYGKTTVSELVASIWGEPKALVLAQVGETRGGSTFNAAINHVASLNNLPVLLDEATNTDEEVMRDILLLLTGGTEKRRLDSSAAARGVRMWNLIAISAANRSLRSKLGNMFNTRPLDSRYLEIELRRPVGQSSASDAVVRQYRSNYGHAGHVYAGWLTRNRAAIEAELPIVAGRIAKDMSLGPTDRFLFRYLACCEVAMRLVNASGLLPLTEEVRGRLLQFAHQQVLRNRAAAEAIIEQRGSLVEALLLRLFSQTLVVDKNPGDGSFYAVREPRGAALAVRVDKHRQCVYLAHSAIRHDGRITGATLEDYIKDAEDRGLLVARGKGDPARCHTALGAHLSSYPQARVPCMRLRASLDYLNAVEAAADGTPYEDEDEED